MRWTSWAAKAATASRQKWRPVSGTRCELSSPATSSRCMFNGKKLFDVEDNTFSDAGKVGVWTKADSVTLFDDFTYGSK